MAKTMNFKEGVQRHPEITVRPVSTRDWQLRFQPNPPTSLKALLIKLGPFIPNRDAFRFDNEFTFTDEQVDQVLQRFQSLIDSAVDATPLQEVRNILNSLTVSIPILGTFGLPDSVINFVIGAVRRELVRLLIGPILDHVSPTFGRCGGMAFSGYDFYLLGWTVDDRLGTTPPATGVLGDYIFNRLLDSLELNVGTFLEWFTKLHLLPKVSTVANVALEVAVGSFLGGRIGAAFLELLGAQVHVFDDLGGPKSFLQPSKDEWSQIKSRLDGQAAWPVGLLFGDSDFPWDDHQVLGLSYDDPGGGMATLTVWDNRDIAYVSGSLPSSFPRDLYLDFTGDELKVQPVPSSKGAWQGGDIKGIFREEYSPLQPPDSLRLS
jgi:hypothetical protein